MSEVIKDPRSLDVEDIEIISTIENKLQFGLEVGCKLKTPRGEIELIWYSDDSEEKGESNPNAEVYMEARMGGEKGRVNMLSPHGFIVIEDKDGNQSVWGWGHTGNYPNETFDGKNGDVITPLLGKKGSGSHDFHEDLLSDEEEGSREFQEKYYDAKFSKSDIKMLDPDAEKAWVIKDKNTITPIELSD